MAEVRKLTKAELINELRLYSDDTEIIFGVGDLTLYRVKSRGDKLAQIEFNETYELT